MFIKNCTHINQQTTTLFFRNFQPNMNNNWMGS